MSYDEDLASRIRSVIADEPGLTEKKMFGGLAFLVGGRLAVAASGQGGLLVRTDPANTAAIVHGPGMRPMEMRGRPMRGWLLVDADQVRTDTQLARWVDVGVTYARTLPPKH